MELYQHQKDLIQSAPNKLLLAWEPGTGKTAAAIGLAAIKDKQALVVCPKSLPENWFNEIIAWQTSVKFDILTKEQFRSQHRSLPRYEILILDEAHYFSGMKSQMYKAARWYINRHQIKYVYLLTATPYMSTPWNIYALATLLGQNWAYNEFEERFFTMLHSRTGRVYKSRELARYAGCRDRDLIPLMKKHIEEDIASLVNSIGVTKKLSECVDVPDSVYKVEYFVLNADQKQAIKNLSDTQAIARYTKEHQICGGTLKGDEFSDDQIYENEKLDRLVELIFENPKLIVICHYRLEMDMIINRLRRDKRKKINTKKIFVLNGQSENRQQIIDDANAANDCVFLINMACSEGYNLPTFNIVVFYSYSFSLKDYLQIERRVQRITNPQKCLYISLIVKCTIDEDVYKCIQNKQDFQIAIYKK